MAEARVLDSVVAAGLNDAGHFQEGWHERSRDGRAPIPFRACGRTGSIHLRHVQVARRLHILMSAPVGVAGRPISGTAHICGERHALILEVDAWVLRTFDLPADAGPILTVSFSCDDPVVPDNVLRNGDGRELGWYVSAIWQD